MESNGRVKLQYRPEIDGLRAIAVVLVVLFHLDIEPFSGGYIGVDVFFVISGFLISNLIFQEFVGTGNFSFRRFYLRRCRRILPALLVTCIATLAVAALLFSPSSLQRLGGSAWTSIISVANIFLWTEADYFDVSAATKPLLHMWSLSIEEQFYLVWPAVFVFSLRRSRRFALSLIGTAIGISLVLNLVFQDGSPSSFITFSSRLRDLVSNGQATIFYLLPFRVFEFLIGACLVFVVPKWTAPSGFLKHSSIYGLIMIAAASVFFDKNTPFPTYFALVPCIGAAMIILNSNRNLVVDSLTSRAAVYIGRISYSLYLIHWPIIVFATYMFGSLGSMEKIFIALSSVVLASANYHLIEQPFRCGNRLASNKSFVVTLLGVVVMISILAYSFHSSGWTWRISIPAEIEVASNPKNYHRKQYGGAGYPYYDNVIQGNDIDLVLIGDSHGRHYTHGVVKDWAIPLGLKVTMSAGTSCLNLPGFTNKKCESALKKTVDHIQSSKLTTVAIMAHRWLPQMERARIYIDDRSKTRTAEIDDVLDGISNLARTLSSTPIVLIGAVPESAGVNVYEALTRPRPFVGNSGFQQFYSSPIREEVRELNRRLSLVSKQFANIFFFDPHEVLCEGEACLNIVEKRLVYSDAHHLSKFGSRFVISSFLKSQEYARMLQTLKPTK